MTERTQVWHVLRDRVAPFGHFQRIESATELGIPDVNYCVRPVPPDGLGGVEGWLELKVGRREGTCPASLTLEQVMWASRRTHVGGRVYMLVRYDRPGLAWHLYDAAGMRALREEQKGATPVLRAAGEFPARELLKVLMCRG